MSDKLSTVAADDLGQHLNQNDDVVFHYIKGPDFRTIHVDGALGGITPKGFLHIAFYAERAAIPQQTTHRLTHEGQLGDEILEKRICKEGLVRQMETDLIMNEETTISLRDWLNTKIEEFDKRKIMMAEMAKEKK
jgi:hypothetical protein